jgi:Hint domain-containing protein
MHTLDIPRTGYMSDLNLPTGIQSSRRHLMKMGAIAAYAVFASITKTRLASANGNGNGQGGNGQGGNGQGGNGQGGNGQISCFLRGTTIRTAEGDRKVEDLAVGDLLPTVFGGIRPIHWIGRYPFKKSDPAKAWVRDVLPVRVARSALGPDIPNADLYVTKAHALLIDGVLVPVCNLINDTTITLYDAGSFDELEFFHIKLELHDVIYAEGAPCETLVSVDENAVNFAEYLRQYGPPMIKDARCAPWVGFGRRIEIKSRFRSAISPWIDRRQNLDIIRDKLEERGIALLQQSELG